MPIEGRAAICGARVLCTVAVLGLDRYKRAMKELYLEDFTVGQRFISETRQVDADQIKGFAAQFDPQPFHLDEAQAETSFFHGLAASGWHTAAITMSLLVKSGMPIANNSQCPSQKNPCSEASAARERCRAAKVNKVTTPAAAKKPAEA